MIRIRTGLIAMVACFTLVPLLGGCDDNGGPPPAVTVTGATITGMVSQSVLMAGSLPVGSAQAPAPDAPVAGVVANTATIGITTQNPIDIFYVGIQGSGSFDELLVSAAARQVGGPTHYVLRITLSGFDPQLPAILNISQQTGALISQAASVNLAATGTAGR